MTKDEAIKVLNDYDINFERNTPEEVAEAHEMAIEALKTQPSEDCISRQAAIDAFHSKFTNGFDGDRWWNSTYVLDAINKVPSITPQPSERTEERTETHACDCVSEMTREEQENALHCLKVMIDEEVCEECNLYGTTGTDHCEADCVRVAIKALQEYQYYKDLAESYEKTINKLTKAIAEQQPKEEPQQKTGHWVLSGGYWRCSECKEKALLKLDKATGGYREYEPVRSKYCPECGAKMQEAKE